MPVALQTKEEKRSQGPQVMFEARGKFGELSDEELIEQLLRGCNDAISVLFDRYSRLVMSVAGRILRDQGEAEEITQSVFFDVYRSATRFDASRGSVRVWILQFAYHRSIRRKQQLTRDHFYDAEPISEMVEHMMKHVSRHRQSLTPQETIRLTKEALGLLNDKQRRVLELTYFEGFTAEEIAKQTSDSVASVRHSLYRGLAYLRAHLEPAGSKSKETAGAEHLITGDYANARA